MSADLTAYEEVLAALAPSANGNGYVPGAAPEAVASVRWPCPVCGSSDSLALARGDDGRALLLCHAACGAGTESYHAILDALDLAHLHAGDHEAVTVELLAEALGIPEDWLHEAEWEDSQWYPAKGVTVERVAIPYPNSTRYRNRLLVGSKKFSWPKGAKVADVGLYRGDDLTPEHLACVLVEGESDAVVSRYGASTLTVGLPGAGTWDEEAHAPMFKHVETIYAVIEPDGGGAKLEASLRASSVAPKVRVVTPTDAQGHVCKDTRESYLSDPVTFAARWNALLVAAKSFEDIDHEETLQRIMEARKVAGDLVHGDDLLDRLLKMYEQNGLVGEQPIAAATTLTLVSAPSNSPADVIVKGTSSGGKSFAVREAREHFPSCFYVRLTGASDKSLYYIEPGSLKHKIMSIEEATGLEQKPGQSNGLAEAIRVLQSEGELSYLVTLKQKDGTYKAQRVQQDGPTGLIVTTTANLIHPENETRALSLSIDDRREQTKQVMRARGAKRAGKIKPADKTQWFGFFEALYLQCLGVEVVVPYGEALAELLEPVAVRMRRDIDTLLDFVCAHAILHYNIRDRDPDGNIVATVADYERVRYYLGAAFTETATDGSVREPDRENVAAVQTVLERKALSPTEMQTASVTEVAKVLGLDKSATSRRLGHTIDSGWIKNLETKPGLAAQLVLGNTLPETEDDLLPTAEAVQALHDQLQQAVV